MNPCNLDLLAHAVQTNCHIADARHASDMTLCIYLLQMREFYRWEKGIAPMHSLSHDAVGAWLSAREALWNQLEESPWQALVVEEQSFDPFDVVSLNKMLQPQGLVYGAGFTGPGRASFFLGELTSVQQRDGVPLWVSGREYARGLSSPPAALSNNTIFLRQESLQRWVWEKYETWTLRRSDGAFKSALDAYDYATIGEQALERMAQAQAETLILHELGEARVASLLGPDWADMRSALSERRTELYARAARDLLADCLVTLPTLLGRRDDAALHFMFSNFDGLRAHLFPRLINDYTAWCAGDRHALPQALAHGAMHWQQVCQQVLALHHAQGDDAQVSIKQLLESHACVLQ
ncbi:MAG TPA: hypothetical protein PKH72_04545 [Rhodoferax sp.]|jgi:hypothetical protein|nr:Sfum_1244 family protein [Rhodoferax sp.]HNV58898.1 hypothetical protein [Rhodoferax sp.]HPW28456.1 hypothetical protein [Rhodoferax sp.]